LAEYKYLAIALGVEMLVTEGAWGKQGNSLVLCFFHPQIVLYTNPGVKINFSREERLLLVLIWTYLRINRRI